MPTQGKTGMHRNPPDVLQAESPFPSTTTEPESTTTTTTTSTTMPGGCTPGDPRGCAATECCNPSTHMCCDPFAPGCGFLVNSCCGPVPLQADFCGGPGSPAVCPVMSCQLGMIYKCVYCDGRIVETGR